MPENHKKIIFDSSGISLFIIVFIFFLIFALITAGILGVGPLVTKYKNTSTRNTLESDINSIISWSAAYGYIPNATNFASALKNPNDAWGKPFVYIYDANFASLTSTNGAGGLCGITSAAINTSTGINDVAFLIISGGSDYTVNTTLTGTLNGTTVNGIPATSGAFSGSVTASQLDIVRAVTRTELQGKAGCFGRTGGYLRIVNTELPSACNGSAYNGSVFGDGGALMSSGTKYNWCIQGTASGLTFKDQTGTNSLATSTSCSSGGTWLKADYLNITGTPTATSSLTFFAADYNSVIVQKTLPIVVNTCAGAGVPPGGAAQNNNPSGGINTGTPVSGGGGGGGSNTSSDSTALSNNIAPSSGGTTGLAVQNNVIEFGFNVGNGAACVWYPYNFPVLGKTLRAFWNFCFANTDNSSNSMTYADGYTFALMQANNPTTYCGTGASDSAQTPYDCQYGGALGEFLSYCGLPGNNLAVEFDIYPNTGRDDPTNYNHVAFVQSISTHTGPTHAGTYGDNTHNVWGNPACSCNGTCTGTGATCTGLCNTTAINNGTCASPRICYGTCTGTCNGTSLSSACNGTCTGTGATCTGLCNGAYINSAACAGTCYGTCTGTCNGTGLGCVFNNTNGSGTTYQNSVNGSHVTWMEDGCNAGYTNHDARVELHTRCNGTCSSCETASCTSTALLKVWIDGGNNNLGANETSLSPDLAYCFTLPSAMNQAKIGFTEGTGASDQLGYIANFIANVYGSCPEPSITATSLPRINPNHAWTATFSATGGTPPYTWSWSAANLTNAGSFTSSTLPAGCTTSSINSSTGTITCTPTSAGPYNTVLVSATDSCTTDTCNNTVSMNLSPTCNFTTNPVIVAYGNTATLSWTMTNSPANGTWTTSPGGTCSNFTNQTSGTCTTGPITALTTYPLTVTNDFGTMTCSATVNITCPTLSITTTSPLPGGTVGTGYSTTLASSGSVAPLSWVISSGSLPPGLSLTASTGVISGTPSTSGSYSFTVQLTDSCSGGRTVSQSYTLQITPPPPTCTLTPTSNIVAYNGTTGLTWTISNGPANGSWTVAPGGSCSSFSNSAGGSCTTGNLTTPGANTYTLKVTNANGNNSCSATVYVGCQGYRVWNNYNANERPFSVVTPAGASWCNNGVTQGSEITDTTLPHELTTSGGVDGRIYRYSHSNYSNGTYCTGGTAGGPITYTQAMTADIVANGGDGDCQVYYNSTDGVTDK
ncbi:MAG: putative Ig domain-containing protein [Nitrospirae bacterium]|nr:putative Ig domain-containing protein [Nitrospirota bacterium]